MKITGIVFLVIGFLALAYLVFDLFDPNGRNEVLPFLSQTWSAILASFLLGAGAALLVASQPKYRSKNKEKINS
ncbi:lipopolysaccharide export LptBFGC system permease protein LptF [Catalinimonas alkaloidigena]|uniref:hypothetical protein n=1 Tax=Catalinimonas alkaloidigena TaxID=1075417 RepID=UPI00240718F3|nr:hypothetical protein [Catalinimonas alkaloidigena]MDF9796869.1 lipopolysaccharide export LptBFGC system permease protein LptF [Catalinimonas alkaloidigena]